MVAGNEDLTNEELTEASALMLLNALPGVGPILCQRLLDRFAGRASVIFRASRSDLLSVRGLGESTLEKILNWEDFFDLKKEQLALASRKICFVSGLDLDYPEKLKQIYDPPIGFYLLGQRSVLTQPCVSIVGTRLASAYGLKQARRIGAALARIGFTIVSGMARGVDYQAHEGALEVGGKTLAVLGNGIDIIYPPEHFELYQTLSERGAIISEFPLGRRADRQSFPMRNRIIAGLAEAVIVIESGCRGGSMITANFALEGGREVFALPGRIDQPQSQGCLKLIQEGANLYTSVEQFLEELRHNEAIQTIVQSDQPEWDATEPPEDSDRQMKGSLNLIEKKILACFKQKGEKENLMLTEIAIRSAEPIHKVIATLVQLELKHCLIKNRDGSYESKIG